MEAGYDRDKAAESFRESAELAEWFYKSHVQDGLRDTNAASKRDELLARMIVFGHLREGEFLATREQLLAELRWLAKHDRPMTPRNALDANAFARHRSKLLQSLIQRFEQSDGEEPPAHQEPLPRRAQG